MRHYDQSSETYETFETFETYETLLDSTPFKI
jgi:hypothetical protein